MREALWYIATILFLIFYFVFGGYVFGAILLGSFCYYMYRGVKGAITIIKDSKQND